MYQLVNKPLLQNLFWHKISKSTKEYRPANNFYIYWVAWLTSAIERIAMVAPSIEHAACDCHSAGFSAI